MNSNIIIKTMLTAIVAAFVAVPTSYAAPITWSWAAGDAPWVSPNGSNTAVFADNDGAIWKLQSAPFGLASPDTWENLTATGSIWYTRPTNQFDPVATQGAGGQVDITSGDPSPNSLTNSISLTFVAPITGNYSISGKAFMGWWGGGGNGTISVGTIQSNTFTQLALYQTPTNFGGVGPDFSTYTALNSISLTAGDSIAFIVPISGYDGQRWYPYDPNNVINPAINANALTITVPEPGTWTLLSFGLASMMFLRRRRA